MSGSKPCAETCRRPLALVLADPHDALVREDLMTQLEYPRTYEYRQQRRRVLHMTQKAEGCLSVVLTCDYLTDDERAKITKARSDLARLRRDGQADDQWVPR